MYLLICQRAVSNLLKRLTKYLVDMAVVTLATGEKAQQECMLLLFTLEQYTRPLPIVYVFTDSVTAVGLKAKAHYKGDLRIRETMNAYTGLDRKKMEKMPGVRYANMFSDYTCEKIGAMRIAFEETWAVGSNGVWFLDADITLFGQLPHVPLTAEVALSPHLIRNDDEARYGRYNAGFMWFGKAALFDVWEKACKSSRFFEQAALEEVAAAAGTALYEFPIQHNFGWWRMWQSEEGSTFMQGQFGFNRMTGGIGLTFMGKPIGSVHTHCAEKDDYYIGNFNKFILDRLSKLGKHKPMLEFLHGLRQVVPAVRV